MEREREARKIISVSIAPNKTGDEFQTGSGEALKNREERGN